MAVETQECAFVEEVLGHEMEAEGERLSDVVVRALVLLTLCSALHRARLAAPRLLNAVTV